LRKHFDGELEIVGEQCGMHLTARLLKKARDIDIANRAAERDLWIWPLSIAYSGTPTLQGLMLGFGNVATQDIGRGVRLLREIVSSQ
jgi:GntR family transcriptional regulator/MocR family aminotransferase